MLRRCTSLLATGILTVLVGATPATADTTIHVTVTPPTVATPPPPLVTPAPPIAAAPAASLRTIRGNVRYSAAIGANFQRVESEIPFADGASASTESQSNALITLADNSDLALGPSTSVRVTGPATPGDPTTVSLVRGVMRFDIRHLPGNRSNYIITTPGRVVHVHGTIGLISAGPTGEIACLSCGIDDVVVSAGSKTFPMKAGQRLGPAAGGAAGGAGAAVLLSATSAADLAPFAAAGLSTLPGTISAFVGVAAAAGSTLVTAGSVALQAGATLGTIAAMVGKGIAGLTAHPAAALPAAALPIAQAAVVKPAEPATAPFALFAEPALVHITNPSVEHPNHVALTLRINILPVGAGRNSLDAGLNLVGADAPGSDCGTPSYGVGIDDSEATSSSFAVAGATTKTIPIDVFLFGSATPPPVTFACELFISDGKHGGNAPVSNRFRLTFTYP